MEEDCTGDSGVVDIFCPKPPEVSDWSEWSACSKQCDGGKRRMTRTCTAGMFGVLPKDNLCPTPNHASIEIKEEECNTHECKKDCRWHPWTHWSACSQSCRTGNKRGERFKTRYIMEMARGEGTQCDGNRVTEECGYEVECPVDGEWTPWSEATCRNAENCGRGQQTLTRVCEGRIGNGKLCLGEDGRERSYEDKVVGCQVLKPGTTSPKHCPIDCKLSEWGKIPSCRAACDSSKTVYYTRKIVTDPQYGGKKCSTDLRRSFTCYGGACPSCYARSSLVSLANGESIRMEDLRVGQLVQVTDTAGVQGTSKFVGWTDKGSSLTEFYKLTTDSGNTLTMTGNHGLFIWNAATAKATFAKDLSVGDLLVVSKSSNKSQVERLANISIVAEFGALGPLTQSGTLIVNNISTSCYASYPHDLAHMALLPARWWPHIFLDDEESQMKEGTRNYITNIKWLGRILSPSGFRIDSRYMETDDRGTNYVAPLVSALAISISAVVLFKKASP